MIYLAILILLLIPVILYDFIGLEKGKSLFLTIEFLALVLLAGLRFRVGGDTLFYISLFEEYPTLDDLKSFDFLSAEFNPLWYVINAISKSIDDSFTTFQIIHAIIINFVFFWFFKKHTKYYFSAIAMYFFGYFCYFNMEIMREVLAICCFLIAIPSLNSKSYFKYYAISSIAVLIHFSALFIFVIPILQKLFKNVTWKSLIIAQIIVGVVLSSFNFIPQLLDLFSFNELVQIKLETYTESEVNLTNILFYYGTTLPILIFLFVNRQNTIKFSIDNINGLLFIYSILMLCSAFYHTVFTRLSNYLIPVYIIYCIDMYQNTKHEAIKHPLIKLSMIIILFFQSYFYWRDESDVLKNTRFYVLYYPYHSVFDPQHDDTRELFLSIYRQTSDF